MQPNNLTALDFDDIKSSIKSYLKTRKEFTDYDFEGSGLSYLIDILAYNTYYTAFMANMAMNEAFLTSATIRDNIVAAARILNYVPRSITSSKAYAHLDIQTRQTGGAYPNSITLNSGPFATGGNYTWNRIDPLTASVDQSTGRVSMRCVQHAEGTIIKYSYVVNNFIKQKYYIPSSNADIATLKVSVRANESTTESDIYNLVENITTVSSTDRIYYLNEGEDMRYEVSFGDGIVGRKLGDGEVVDLEFLITNGAEANDVETFSFIGNLSDSNGQVYSPQDVQFTVAEKSRFGDDPESAESIKYQAPRFYAAQYRAVTAQDYEVITKKLYDNAKSVVAYGGDEIYPPVYGKVFIAIETKTGSRLNDTTKKSLSQQLRPYAMASIEPVIKDVEKIFVYPRVFVTYDPACSSRSVSNINTNINAGITDWAKASNINNFGGSFSLSRFERAITASDRCVSDVSTQVSLLKYIDPKPGETNTYCITTGAPLYDSAPGQTDSSCFKEPIVRSGTFRTADRPTIDQYFQDDGFGNLVTYYDSGNRSIPTNTLAGKIDYETGDICFGPVNIIGVGSILLPIVDGTPTDPGGGPTDPEGGGGNVEVDPTAVDFDEIDFTIPVMIIPQNTSTIPTPTPDTVIAVITPEISVNPIGTTPPPTVPLNSLTPSIFGSSPSTVSIPDITNPGDFTDISCF